MENICNHCNKENSQSFCISCNYMVCNSCIKHHKKVHNPKKTPRGHSTDFKLCSECKRYGYICVSDKICSGCVRNFCNECCGQHKCKNDTGRKGVTFGTPVCEPCECMTIISTAKIICVDCDEFLCERCNDQHLASKIFQCHKLRPINVPGKTIRNTLLCESCKRSNNEEPAVFTCCDCDNEVFCESCAVQHTTFKSTKHHKVTSTVQHAKFTDDKGEQTESFGKQDIETQTFPNEYSLSNSKHTPGIPKASYIGIDSITLTWKEAQSFDESGYYQVSYIDIDNHGKWVYVNDQELKVTNITISSLKANTAYRFRVRMVTEVGEGPYSPLSDKITTRNSSAGMLMSFSKKLQNGNPSPAIYALPISENREIRNEKAKTIRFEIGESAKGNSSTEKSIMLVGTSGSGKCTFVDNMINYILGVQWTDSFRFTTKRKQIEEENKSAWINIYSIRPEQGSRLQYRLNIVDVPSFDASKALTENLGIAEQVRVLLSESAPRGLEYLDAVCFIVKSTDTELSKFQHCMFQYLLLSFGKDLEENIFAILPFSDSKDPQILNYFRKTDLPFRKTFKFNSSALFLANVGLKVSTTLPLFWDAAKESFDIFFEELGKTKVRGMQQTTVVIEQQFRLKQNFEIMQKQVDNVLQKVNELNNEQNKINHEENLIKANENFKTVVEETVRVINELPSGSYAVNCIDCKFTCCTSVASQTAKIENCDAFDSSDGCNVCNCLPLSHNIESNIYTTTKEPVTKIDQTQKDAYDKAAAELQRLELRVPIMSRQMNELCDTLEKESEMMNNCRQQIVQNSLWPHVKGFENEIDVSIEKEKEERQEGFIDRIRKMREIRKYLEITDNIDKFAQDARSVLCVVGRKRKENADAQSNMTRFAKLFRHLHSE